MRIVFRRQTLTPVCVLGILAVSVSISGAQTPGQQSARAPVPRVQVTPFFAIGDDLAPGGGGAFTIPWTRDLRVEAEVSLGTDAARSSVSLLYGLPKWGRYSVYVAAGGGVQRDELEDRILDVGFVTRKKSELAVNLGAGMTMPLSERLGYRVDFRWYNPKREWPESWRVFNGVTVGFGHASEHP